MVQPAVGVPDNTDHRMGVLGVDIDEELHNPSFRIQVYRRQQRDVHRAEEVRLLDLPHVVYGRRPRGGVPLHRNLPISDRQASGSDPAWNSIEHRIYALHEAYRFTQ